MFKGIDVSYFQGMIDWDAVKPHIDFAMIRAGFGRNTIDNKATRNIAECERLNIPLVYTGLVIRCHRKWQLTKRAY